MTQLVFVTTALVSLIVGYFVGKRRGISFGHMEAVVKFGSVAILHPDFAKQWLMSVFSLTEKDIESFAYITEKNMGRVDNNEK